MNVREWVKQACVVKSTGTYHYSSRAIYFFFFLVSTPHSVLLLCPLRFLIFMRSALYHFALFGPGLFHIVLSGVFHSPLFLFCSIAATLPIFFLLKFSPFHIGASSARFTSLLHRSRSNPTQSALFH